MLKLRLRSLVLVCLGFLLAVGVHLDWSSAQESPPPALPLPPGAQVVPDALLDCVDGLKDYPDRYILLSASAVVKGETLHYYTIGVNRLDREAEAFEGDARTPPPEKRYWETTVSVNDKGECQVLVARNQPFQTLQAFMPRVVARDLALQRIKQYVDEDHGIKKLQAAINQVSEAQTFLNRHRPTGAPVYESVTYAPEMVWALKQVGVKVPSNIPVYPEPKADPKIDTTPARGAP